MLKKIDPALLGSTIATIVRVWGKLLRYEQKQYAVINQIRKKRPLIYALWHDELFAPCYFHRQEGIIAVVSSSRDGEILSQVMLKLGYNLARGSSNRGGLRALREALKKMQSLQKDVVFTVDGPQGPRHSVKEGIIYLAQKTQSPIVPLRVYTSQLKRFEKSWDRFQLPLPMAKCSIVYGQPYKVEQQKLTAEILQIEQGRLKEKLDSLF